MNPEVFQHSLNRKRFQWLIFHPNGQHADYGFDDFFELNKAVINQSWYEDFFEQARDELQTLCAGCLLFGTEKNPDETIHVLLRLW